MKATLLFILLAGWAAGCARPTENVARIPHISALHLADSNGVTFESLDKAWRFIAKSPGWPLAINTNEVTHVILQAGHSFMLTDGYHGSVIYKLVRITDGQIIVEETTTDRPPDAPKVTTTVRRIRVSPYSRETAATAKTLSQEEIGLWVTVADHLFFAAPSFRLAKTF